MAVSREVMGDDAANFLAAALFEGGTLDFVVRDLPNETCASRSGNIRPPRRALETVDAPAESEEASRFVARALVARHGTLSLPVDVDFTLDDGAHVRKSWDGRCAVSVDRRREPQPRSRRGSGPRRKDPDRRRSLEQRADARARRHDEARRTWHSIPPGSCFRCSDHEGQAMTSDRRALLQATVVLYGYRLLASAIVAYPAARVVASFGPSKHPDGDREPLCHRRVSPPRSTPAGQ